jgi:ATPase subunit of ABC transporter with duplicated ATPase domains
MTVVFEVLSPGNTPMEMADKQDFYERHGVEEYYVFDPEKMALHMYLRQGEVLRRVRHLKDFVSPRLGIRFDLTGDEMVVFGPDGQRFLSFEELKTAQARAEARADQAEQRADQAQAHVERAEARADQAEARAEEAEARADQAEKRAANAEATTAKAELLRKRLAELSRKARRGQASPEELAELERLEANGTSNS